MADFFDKEEQEQEVEDKDTEDKPQMFKIGDEEYSQDDLQKLVGLGKLGQEAEEKYNVKLDKVWPNLQATINEKRELEKRLEEIENSKVQQKAESGEQLTPEEQKRQALAQADQLGLIHSGNVMNYVNQYMAAYELRQRVNEVIEDAKADGNPTTTVDNLLEFMRDPANPSDPVKAYKMMFEDELDRIKEEKIRSLKPSGMMTQDSSTAGSKQAPAPKPIRTREDLDQALKQHFASSEPRNI